MHAHQRRLAPQGLAATTGPNTLRPLLALAGLLFALLLAVGPLQARAGSAAAGPTPTPTRPPLTPAQLIELINRVRTSRGLRGLIVDPILMGTAQSTADIMAAYQMQGHIGDVRSRVIAAGYGAGDIPWATENYIVLPPEADPLVILDAWSDDLHMKPMADVNYRHVGAGVAQTADGAVYYVLHAAYTSNRTYQPYVAPTAGVGPGGTILPAPTSVISQYINAVVTATPQPDGSLVHVVRNGQSLWSIAIAYQTHIEALQALNGMARSQLTIYTGQKLRIPTRAATPEPADTDRPAQARISAAASQPAPAATLTPSPTGTLAPTAVIPNTGLTPWDIIPTALVVLAIVGVGLVAFGMLAKR